MEGEFVRQELVGNHTKKTNSQVASKSISNKRSAIGIYYILYIPYYILPIDCLFIDLDAQMFSHNEYGPGTKDQGPRSCGGELGDPAPWALGPGPGPISVMAACMGIQGNQYANNRRYIYIYRERERDTYNG